MLKKTLVLLGMMAVGKTTLGKIVAKKKNLKFIDIDSVIEKKNSMTISEIFENKDEKFFRKEEEKIVLEAIKQENSVISLGGGAFINPKIRNALLAETITIWLDLDIKTLSKRVEKNFKRPLLQKNNNKNTLKEIYAKRKDVYNLAHHKINCKQRPLSLIAKDIVDIYEKY